jgi:hypothetical protein
MNLEYFISQMEINADSIKQLVQGVTDEQAQWKPDPETWSKLEVINHLFDEEQADFRVRLDYILHRPGEPWPPIDPKGWVTERKYNQRDLDESVANFQGARLESLTWLKGLSSPDWQTESEAPWGKITAGDMFAAWVAHDLLHTRQLVELRWAYTVHRLGSNSTEYAGTW